MDGLIVGLSVFFSWIIPKESQFKNISRMLVCESACIYGFYVYTLDMYQSMSLDIIKMLITMIFVPAFMLVGSGRLAFVNAGIVVYLALVAFSFAPDKYYVITMLLFCLLQFSVIYQGVSDGFKQRRDRFRTDGNRRTSQRHTPM